MTTSNCTDDELDAAVMAYLVAGPGSTPPLRLRAGAWLSSRQETREAFAERFPRQMDQFKPRKKRK